MKTMPLEADTRLLIDNNLKNLGWHLTGKEQNVFCERPRLEEEQKKLKGKRPDYVLYSNDSNTPLIVIEAKRKGERIDTALEQGISYAKRLEAPLVYATDGVFSKSYHTIGNTTPKLNGEDVDEFIREALALKFLTKWEINTISPKVQYDRKELIKIFDEANNMLRGDGLRAGIERFGEFANILFLKLISETEDNKKLAGQKSNFDGDCHWDYIKELMPSARIDYINNIVYGKLNDLYGTRIFTPLLIRDGDILKSIIDKLDPLTLTDVDSDVKGDAFEYFLKESTSTKNDLGEYFTPRHIVKTMVRLVNPQIGEKIYDPFCGTGGFLIESFRHIHNNMPRNPSTEKILREETIYGNEITNTARITKMNMILAGDGHSNIHMQDSLANPVEGKYDVVLANMPYSQKTKYGSLYDLPSKNGDSICVQHCMKAINALSENGRMALVVPEGFLFRKDLAKVREYLLENAQLQSIISLPQGVFLPYTGVKTNIIYATKVNQKTKASEKRKDFWYFDVKSDGYTLDSHRRKLDTPSDLAKYEEYRKLDQEQTDEMMQVGFEVIPIEKVRKNSNILVGGRYREIEQKAAEFSMVNLGDKRYFTICSGGTPDSTNSEYWDGDINWITLADIPTNNCVTKIYNSKRTISQKGLNNSSAKLLPIGTIVVSSRATIGRIGITKTKLATNQGFKNIIVNRTDLILPEYLAYILTKKKDEMISLSSGATFKEISKASFETMQVPIPPINKQAEIISEIEGYQKIIDGARTVIEAYRPSIKVTSEFELVDFSDIATLTRGVNYKKAQQSTCNTPNVILPADNITLFGELEIQKEIFVDHTTKLVEAKRLQAGDVFICMSSGSKKHIGKVAYIEQDTNYYAGGFMGIIRTNPQRCLSKFLYYYLLTSEKYKEEIKLLTQGANIYNISSTINLIKIPLPSLEAQQQTIEEIEKEKILIDSNKQLIKIYEQKIQDRIAEVWN